MALASVIVSEPHRGHHAALALAKPYGVDYTQAYGHHNHREARPISKGPPRRVSAYEISKSTGFHVDFTWISDFRLDFWISRGFLDFKADFWISRGFPDFKVDFYILDFA